MKKERDTIIFGIHAVNEALDAGRELEKVLIKGSKTSSDTFLDLKRRLLGEKIPFQQVPLEKLNSVTKKNHQGVIAYISEIAYSDVEFILSQVFERGRNPLVLVLDQVSDVRNFGAIARTAEIAGVDAIVVPYKGSARITGEAVKTSAGALHRIPVCRHPDLRLLLNYLKSSGLQVFGASERAERTLFQADLSVPAAILMGSEDRGISDALFEFVDHRISIPQYGAIGSLNVSVAAGIIMYEAVRQRLTNSTQEGSGD